MFQSKKMGISCVVMLSLIAVVGAVGCQKKFDPNAFEAGAASAQAAASAAPVDSSAATDPVDASTDLAPLDTSKPVAHPTTPAGKGTVGPSSHVDSTPKVDPPECVQARNICNNPSIPVRKGCKDATSACFNKGGHL